MTFDPQNISFLCDEQRDFVESDAPRLCYDVAEHNGGGATWALIMAAARFASTRPGSNILLVVGYGDWLANALPKARRVFAALGFRELVDKHSWVQDRTRIDMVATANRIHKTRRYDFVGLDEVQRFGVEEIIKAQTVMNPGGLLRSVFNSAQLARLVGNRIVYKSWHDNTTTTEAAREAIAARVNHPIKARLEAWAPTSI